MRGWFGVEPRHLVALLAVQRAGSFRAAATRLGVAPSVVSQRISQLERQLSVRLVDRSPGRTQVALTDAGSKLAEHAEQILGQFDAAHADLRAARHTAMTVGADDGLASSLLPPAVRRLAMSEPELRIGLMEDSDWRRFFPLIARGELDAAFADLPLPSGPFAFRELLRDPYVLVARADSPLARRGRPPTPAELAGLPLIAPSPPVARLIAERLRAAGTEPRFVLEPKTSLGVQALVAHGLGSAVMPRMALNHPHPHIAAIPLEDLLPMRRIVVYWHRDRREVRAIMTFIAALEACDETSNGHGASADGIGALSAA
jgi:DNA-binding transcriptional LysR family regulator